MIGDFSGHRPDGGLIETRFWFGKRCVAHFHDQLLTPVVKCSIQGAGVYTPRPPSITAANRRSTFHLRGCVPLLTVR
ncbi:MAG TPA: hypothetical protein DDW52_13170 [Planctomycetaceae bacterium]|nr:hypothetical protein [Planctomycetaceae bacterium]